MPYKKIKKPPPYKGRTSPIPVDHFGHLDIRVGVIRNLMLHPKASFKYFIGTVNVGEMFSRLCGIGLVQHYETHELIDKTVLACCNIKPQWVRQQDSWTNILVASTADHPQKLELLVPPPGAEPGDVVTVEGYPRDPSTPYMDPDKRIFENIAAFFTGCRLLGHYDLSDLQNRLVVLLCNVYYGWSRGLDSMGALICAKTADKEELLNPPPNSKPGDKVFVEGYGRGKEKIICPADPRKEQKEMLNPKEVRLFDDIAVDLRMDGEKKALYRGLPLQVEGRDGKVLGGLTTDTLADCPITAVQCDEELY